MSKGLPVLAVCLAAALTACGGAPEIHSVDLDADERAACQALVDALPDTLDDLERGEVEPDDALGAAWGDPAIVLTCGAEEPEEFDEFSACDEVLGVGWFSPPDQLKVEQQDEDATLWAMSHRPLVELEVPADYRPDGVAAALAQLAEVVTAELDEVRACH
jgi:hypothetical protein